MGLYEISMGVGLVFTILTIIGIIRPALVVWWSPVKSRSWVFLTYGFIASLAITVALITAGAKEDTVKAQKDPSRMEQRSK